MVIVSMYFLLHNTLSKLKTTIPQTLYNTNLPKSSVFFFSLRLDAKIQAKHSEKVIP